MISGLFVSSKSKMFSSRVGLPMTCCRKCSFARVSSISAWIFSLWLPPVMMFPCGHWILGKLKSPRSMSVGAGVPAALIHCLIFSITSWNAGVVQLGGRYTTPIIRFSCLILMARRLHWSFESSIKVSVL